MTTTWETEALKAVQALAQPFIPGLEGMYERSDYPALFTSCRDWLQQEAGEMMDEAQLVEFLAGKQHDYGPNNIMKFGIQGLRVRMWDKIARIQNLRSRNVGAQNESLVDSFVDLMGYCVLAVMIENGTFSTPLASDLGIVLVPAGTVIV